MSAQRKDNLPALEVVTAYSAAIAAANIEKMKAQQTEDYRLDWVYADAFENPTRTAQEMDKFWPAWFAGFPDMDYEVTRTIAAEEVVVVQWVFTGTNTGALNPPAFREPREATGRIIQFRGVSIYDLRAGLICCETTYIDLATLMVELGFEL